MRRHVQYSFLLYDDYTCTKFCVITVFFWGDAHPILIPPICRHTSDGLRFGGALRQVYSPPPPLFMRGHERPRLDSVFPTIGAPRARGPDVLPHGLQYNPPLYENGPPTITYTHQEYIKCACGSLTISASISVPFSILVMCGTGHTI